MRLNDELETFISKQDLEDEPVSRSRLIYLTCGLGGLQVVWSVILSNGSPYLVSLGMSKSLTPLIWIAAPLCGSFVQPLVGSWSDHIATRWGRRRPFILSGALGISVSLLFLAWTAELTSYLLPPTGKLYSLIVILCATFWVYALNIFIQPLQAGIRSLIVECLPIHRQSQASYYVSIMQGIGNIFGYTFGFFILPSVQRKSMTDFQALSVFASLALCLTAGATCIMISENRVVPHSSLNDEGFGLKTSLNRILRAYHEMPRTIRQVCHIQSLAWMGWFPFLYYSTTYVGEFYAGKLLFMDTLKDRSPASAGVTDILESRSRISQEAIRYGMFASFLFAVVTFSYSIVLPKILSTVKGSNVDERTQKSVTPGILHAWLSSHLGFAILMFSTFFVRGEAAATAIVAFTGLSWAVTLFAPFAIISTVLAAKHALREDTSTEVNATEISCDPGQTGALIGLHNMAIQLPQILSALICSIVYTLAKSLNIPDGTGWVLRVAGVSALGAAWMCRKLGD